MSWSRWDYDVKRLTTSLSWRHQSDDVIDVFLTNFCPFQSVIYGMMFSLLYLIVKKRHLLVDAGTKALVSKTTTGVATVFGLGGIVVSSIFFTAKYLTKIRSKNPFRIIWKCVVNLAWLTEMNSYVKVRTTWWRTCFFSKIENRNNGND